MGRQARRTFLKTAVAGAGVAAAAAGTPHLLWGLFDGPGGEASRSHQIDPSTPLVAFIRDASRGEVALMMGTDEVVVRDAVLVSRLTAAIQSRA